jgi:hypothetical protein
METRLVRSVDIIQHAIDSTAAPLAIFSISINSLSVYTVSSILTLGNFLFFIFLLPLILSKISDGSDFHYRYSSSSIKLLFRFSISQTTIESRSLRHICTMYIYVERMGFGGVFSCAKLTGETSIRFFQCRLVIWRNLVLSGVVFSQQLADGIWFPFGCLFFLG